MAALLLLLLLLLKALERWVLLLGLKALKRLLNLKLALTTILFFVRTACVCSTPLWWILPLATALLESGLRCCCRQIVQPRESVRVRVRACVYVSVCWLRICPLFPVLGGHYRLRRHAPILSDTTTCGTLLPFQRRLTILKATGWRLPSKHCTLAMLPSSFAIRLPPCYRRHHHPQHRPPKHLERHRRHCKPHCGGLK